MAIAPFLAMTAAEFCAADPLPSKIAWMACHFSPYGLGLSNLPKELPPDTLLMVDDITPPHGHDPVLIAEQLSWCIESRNCCGVLLDFQRKGCAETGAIAAYLTGALPCPTAVSDVYASDLDCPVFLSAPPPSVPLEEQLAPWKERSIWMELSADGQIITLTETGSESVPFPHTDPQWKGFADERLHCHYSIQTEEKTARFTLWRTEDDLISLLEEAEGYGISTAVGLFQQLQKPPCFSARRS